MKVKSYSELLPENPVMVVERAEPGAYKTVSVGGDREALVQAGYHMIGRWGNYDAYSKEYWHFEDVTESMAGRV
jgi:hypothetical protein